MSILSRIDREEELSGNGSDYEEDESQPWLQMSLLPHDEAMALLGKPRWRRRNIHAESRSGPSIAVTQGPEPLQPPPEVPEPLQPPHEPPEPLQPPQDVPLDMLALNPGFEIPKVLDRTKYPEAVERVGSSILGDWEVYSWVSDDPVIRWIDRLAIKYCRFVAPPRKGILVHPFEHGLYMKVGAVDLLIWAEELVRCLAAALSDEQCF